MLSWNDVLEAVQDLVANMDLEAECHSVAYARTAQAILEVHAENGLPKPCSFTVQAYCRHWGL